jgi:DNA-binding NarL/FixJ family response regulator
MMLALVASGRGGMAPCEPLLPAVEAVWQIRHASLPTARRATLRDDTVPGFSDSLPFGILPSPLGERPAAPTRLVVVADVCLYREGLANSLARRGEAQVLGTAATRAEAAALVGETRPEVVLLDMATPESPMIVRDARAAVDGVKIVAVAVAESEELVVACAELGLAGYVARTASLDDLVHTLRAVARGELVCPPHIAGSLFRRVAALAGRGAAPASPAPADVLTPREREVLTLIDRGCSNKEISRRLSIELSTVKNHVHNVLEKLHVRRRSAAAARMRDDGG